MEKDLKDLLLRDLCSRLPYMVKVGTSDNDGSLENVWDTLWYNTFTEDVKLTHSIEDADKIVDISEIKPYLFPLSSMTDEQSKIYHELIGGMFGTGVLVNLEILIDWLNKNHFDYRGLILKGLAIDATDLNIY